MLELHIRMAFINKKRPAKPSTVEIEEIHYKNLGLLKTFLSEGGKIISRKYNGLDAKRQRKLQREVKKARELGLLSSN
jgi:small subunit ribosomal protein S18